MEMKDWRTMSARRVKSGEKWRDGGWIGERDVVDQRGWTEEKLPKCELENNKEEPTDDHKETQTKKEPKNQPKRQKESKRKRIITEVKEYAIYKYYPIY